MKLLGPRIFRALVVTALVLPGLFLCLQQLWAATGTESASFLDIPVGAAPASLGGAYTALAMDAYAPTYNPGGLAFLPSNQISGQHLSYLDSLNYEYASFGIPLATKYGGLGGAVQYLGAKDFQGTDHFGSTTNDFSAHYGAYTLAYGLPLTDRWGLGLAGKFIEAKLENVSGSAYAADIGMLYKIQPRWTGALTYTNLGSSLKFIDDGEPLPSAWHLGTAYTFSSHWLATIEGAFPTHQSASLHVGGQWQPIELIQLRAGYRTDTIKENSSIAAFSVGVGLHLWGQDLAYAWLPYDELGSSQYFSFLARFGSKNNGGANL